MADDSLNLNSSTDFTKLKVPDLKKELKNKGLSTTGNKNELIERLQASFKLVQHTDSIDDIEEDLLNDVDDEHLDERDSIIHELENDLDYLPKTLKRKLLEESAKEVETVEPPKKVILKRNNSDTLQQLKLQTLTNEVKSNVITKPQNETIKTNGQEKKIIKLSELSAKERLEMRVKKFGVESLNDGAKKLVRAERFNVNTADKVISTTTSTNIDVLKQRAARFGSSVSSVMSNLEKQEKIEKRKARFGIVTKTNTKITTDLEAAKAARLKRFQTTTT